MQDYAPVMPNDQMESDLRGLVRLAIAEDLHRAVDWTSVCLIDADVQRQCHMVPREGGICAGLVTLPWIVDEFDADLTVKTENHDGQTMIAGKSIATLTGTARDLLTVERVILNVVSKLSGIATLTRRYVDAIAGSKSRLYDTRKTTPGWRRLEKYAVRMGGGYNHRTGLFDGFLIKDNHLALGGSDGAPLSPAAATEKARSWAGGNVENMVAPSIVEIEVDTVEQLSVVLPARPDIVLLDNFTFGDLMEAVRLRDQAAPEVELEASGNVTIDTISEIAQTGVDRISSGALTHQATWLDIGLDWLTSGAS